MVRHRVVTRPTQACPLQLRAPVTQDSGYIDHLRDRSRRSDAPYLGLEPQQLLYKFVVIRAVVSGTVQLLPWYLLNAILCLSRR